MTKDGIVKDVRKDQPKEAKMNDKEKIVSHKISISELSKELEIALKKDQLNIATEIMKEMQLRLDWIKDIDLTERVAKW